MPSTRERVLTLVRQSPHLNQTEIAERVSATRQRVSQIIASEGLTVPKGRRGVAPRAKARAEPAEESKGVPAYLAEAGGPIAVLVAAADLMARGYTVYLPMTSAAAADLVAIDALGNLKRVAVQRARRRGTRLEHERPKPGDVDIHALILANEPVQYRPNL
jgi:hypothetical protein